MQLARASDWAALDMRSIRCTRREARAGRARQWSRPRPSSSAGGNTFRLLDELYRHDLIEPLRRRVEAGMPYMGSSAGSGVACVTIRTTNDMPIVQPPSFAALALVPFNVNAHYLDADPSSRHMGETREQRIAEFHEMNAPPVIGLREGALLRIEGDSLVLLGSSGARLFERGREPREYRPPARLDELLRWRESDAISS